MRHSFHTRLIRTRSARVARAVEIPNTSVVELESSVCDWRGSDNGKDDMLFDILATSTADHTTRDVKLVD
jgi:hypothetical protein